MSNEASAVAVNLMYYGAAAPLPEQVPVRAGPFTAKLEGADLRYVMLNGELVVLRLYAAVRDESWGTVAPIFTEYSLARTDDSFSLTFAAEHVSKGEQGVDFVWRGRITGEADGTITCEMDGAARTPFKRNRIGWCVLHPMTLAGQNVHVDHAGTTSESSFPVAIAPHQPFLDIVTLTHATPGEQAVRFEFAGDIFETEDQRNWTDASYKTYSTPLRIPYPVQLSVGDRVWQRVTLRATRSVPAAGIPSEDVPTVTVNAAPALPLPALGLMTAGHGAPLSEAEQARFRRLRLSHLHHVVELPRPDWLARLLDAATDAGAIGAGLALEVLVGDAGPLAELLAAIGGLRVRVLRIAVFDEGRVTTSDDLLRRVRAARDAAGLDVPIGGGSRAYFTQLNRNAPTPALLDFIAYGINPQVHAFDNASMVETLPAQTVTVASARRLAPETPIVVGPVTLKPRINPDAVPATGDRPPGTLPASVDPRQSSLFGAGWTVGSLRSLAAAGGAALTYYETTGWRGVIERSDHALRVPAFPSRPGIAFPVYHVFADLAELDHPGVIPVHVSTPLAVEALALRSGGRIRLLLASFRNVPQAVTLSLPGGSKRMRVLDETTYDEAADFPDQFREQWSAIPETSGTITLTLRPFAVVTIDIDLTGN